MGNQKICVTPFIFILLQWSGPEVCLYRVAENLFL